MKFICPLLGVNNINESRKFYEEVLSQEVILDFGENITFKEKFSLQSKDSWLGFIEKKSIAIKIHSNNFELYFEEEDFDTFLEKLNQYDIKKVHELREYPWGQRVIRFYDPDWHIIEVGESMATVIKRFYDLGLSIEEIVERTQHPIEFVRKCLDEKKI